MVVRRVGKIIRLCAEQYFKGRLLDIGCGEKLKATFLGDLVEEYVGLDHESTLHDRNCVDIWGSACEIPEPDNSFDSVLCTSVLEHIEEPEQALRESFRILKPGGYAIYTVPFFWHLHEEPRDFFRYSKYGVEYLFNKSGFRVVDLLPLSGFWLTFGSELSYYLNAVIAKPLKHISALGTLVNNLVFPLLDSVDISMNRHARDWTWLYLVVAKKP